MAARDIMDTASQRAGIPDGNFDNKQVATMWKQHGRNASVCE